MPLAEQDADGEAKATVPRTHDEVACAEHAHGPVAAGARDGIGVHLDGPLREVDEPELGDAGRGVDARLDAIAGEGGVGGWLERIWDVTCSALSVDPATQLARGTFRFTSEDGPAPERLQTGELVELTNGFRVPGVGRIV